MLLTYLSIPIWTYLMHRVILICILFKLCLFYVRVFLMHLISGTFHMKQSQPQFLGSWARLRYWRAWSCDCSWKHFLHVVTPHKHIVRCSLSIQIIPVILNFSFCLKKVQSDTKRFKENPKDLFIVWWTASIKPRLLFSRAGYASWGLSLSSVLYIMHEISC